MGLNRRIAETGSIEPKARFRHQRIMDSSTIASGRRWTSRAVENVNALSSTRLPTSSEPTTHQKVRRILEEQAWKARGSGEKRNSSSCVFTNYNIVASKGDVSRGAFAIRESSIDRNLTSSRRSKSPSSDFLPPRRRSEEVGTGRIGREKKSNNWERRREQEKYFPRSRSSRGLLKSSSVPADLKDGLDVNLPTKLPSEGILKRSLLERLTGEKKKESKSSLLKRSVPVSSSRIQSVVVALRKSPSCQSLAPTKTICRSGVKKSVSFSSDTSFEAKRPSSKKSAVHEVKVYRKGVLQDLNDINTLKEPEKKLNEAMALLKAARESDELSLNDLVNRMRRSGLGKVDVNATDSSGRSVISYMAGNGASEMLESVLAFPGANPNLPDNEGNTPLHFAAQAGQAECLNILLQRSAGVELDARNILGFTPLMKAAIQGRTKCAKILLFAGANPTLRDHGRGLKAEQWARFCGRHVCADVIERFARHRLIDRTSCRWGSEPELATKVLQGKVIPVNSVPIPVPSTGLKSRLKRVFRTTTGQDKSFSLVSQLTSAALCASTPALPKPGDIPPAVKNLFRPLSVPQLRVTLVPPTEILDKSEMSFTEKIESSIVKPSRSKKKTK